MFCFFNVTATTEIYTYGHTLSLHDALPILEPRPCPDVHRFVGTVSDAPVVILVGADGDRITGGPGLDHLDLDRGPRAAAQYQPRRHHEQDCCPLAHVRPHPLHPPGCSIRPPRHAGNAHRSETHQSALPSPTPTTTTPIYL